MLSNITMGHFLFLVLGLILGWPLYRWIYKRNPTEVDMINATAKKWGDDAQREAEAFFANMRNRYERYTRKD